jgi:hypothetical protein
LNVLKKKQGRRSLYKKIIYMTFHPKACMTWWVWLLMLQCSLPSVRVELSQKEKKGEQKWMLPVGTSTLQSLSVTKVMRSAMGAPPGAAARRCARKTCAYKGMQAVSHQAMGQADDDAISFFLKE